MGIMKLVLAASLITVHGISMAAAQTTNPLEVLEGARRGRIEQDKRLDRDAAEQQQRDKEIKARQEEAGRTPDPAIARGTEGSAIGARQ
jgi:hypothetical protein